MSVCSELMPVLTRVNLSPFSFRWGIPPSCSGQGSGPRLGRLPHAMNRSELQVHMQAKGRAGGRGEEEGAGSRTCEMAEEGTCHDEFLISQIS